VTEKVHKFLSWFKI